ncbi:hypothetical protein VTG60DRAFT_5326 [Thermothelomyces hinnuleus]
MVGRRRLAVKSWRSPDQMKDIISPGRPRAQVSRGYLPLYLSGICRRSASPVLNEDHRPAAVAQQSLAVVLCPRAALAPNLTFPWEAEGSSRATQKARGFFKKGTPANTGTLGATAPSVQMNPLRFCANPDNNSIGVNPREVFVAGYLSSTDEEG